MKRREFLKSSVALAGAGAALSSITASGEEEANASPRQFFELRLYHLRRGAKTELFDRFYREAAIPALNRAGINPVGVFSIAVGPESPSMYVLLPHPNLNSLATTHLKLAADEEFLKAGEEFLNAPATDPAYVRIDVTLMVSFEGMPKAVTPSFVDGGKSRMFELRTYESASLKANMKKVEMFNRGEIAIFKHAGFQPVFFGQGMIGPRLPNLSYMLCAENRDAWEKGWSTFGADPDWKKLRTTPGYSDADLVSDITNVLLRPAAYSQI